VTRGPLDLTRFEDVVLLREREVRDAHGLYLVEGVRFVVRALDLGEVPAAMVVCPAVLRSPLGQMVARRWRRRGVPLCKVDEDQLRELSLLDAPQGIAAVLPQRTAPLPSRATRGLWLGVEAIRSPGNLGSIARTAAATGADGLIALGDALDPWSPRLIRASMGAHASLSLHRTDPEAFGRWARAQRVRGLGADAHRGRDYRRCDYRGPTVLMVGAERRGLTPSQRRLCTGLLRIPMRDAVDSLNVANAMSVLLYEAYRQRHPPRRG